MGIRMKILSGFLILALMLALAGLWSVYELQSFGASVQAILDENHRSIQAAEEMTEALEREDSAILLLMLGKLQEGRDLLMQADRVFNNQLNFAYSNITIPGEQAYLDSIKSGYGEYKNLWERPIVDTPREGNIEWYFSKVHIAFQKVKTAVNDLASLNNKAMYQTASNLQQKSNHAVMPGLIAIIAALAFSLIFNYFVNYYIVSPIIRITNRIKKFIDKRTPFDVQIETNDELFHLASSVQNLCEELHAKDTRK